MKWQVDMHDAYQESQNTFRNNADRASNALATQNGAQRFEEKYRSNDAYDWKWGRGDPHVVESVAQAVSQNNQIDIRRKEIFQELNGLSKAFWSVNFLNGNPAIFPDFQKYNVTYTTKSGQTEIYTDPDITFYPESTRSLKIIQDKGMSPSGSIVVENTDGTSQQIFFQRKPEQNMSMEKLSNDVLQKLEKAGWKSLWGGDFEMPNGRRVGFGENTRDVRVISATQTRSGPVYRIQVQDYSWEEQILRLEKRDWGGEVGIDEKTGETLYNTATR